MSRRGHGTEGSRAGGRRGGPGHVPCSGVLSSGWLVGASHPRRDCAGTEPSPGSTCSPLPCAGSRSDPSKGPPLFSPSPASFPPALRPASHCSAYPSPSSSSAPSLASSLVSVSSAPQCTGDRALACRGRGEGRRKRSFSCDGAMGAPCLECCSPHDSGSSFVRSPIPRRSVPPWHGSAWGTLSSRGLFQVGLLQPIFGKLELAGGRGEMLAGLPGARARLRWPRAESFGPCLRCIPDPPPPHPRLLLLRLARGERTPLWARRAEASSEEPGPCRNAGLCLWRGPSLLATSISRWPPALLQHLGKRQEGAGGK